MKKWILGLLVACLLSLGSIAPAMAANCFWFGGTGSINDTSKWFAATNGGGGACAASGGWPNSSADNGTFDANSGGGTITRNVNWTIGTLNIAAFTGTFGNSGDTATVLLDIFTNNGAGTRTFNMGATTWTCGRTGVTNCVWQVSGATNLTLNRDTSTLVLENGASSGTALCWFGTTYQYNNIVFSPASNATSARSGWGCNTGNMTIANLTIGSPNTFQFTAGVGWTITGTMAFSGGTPSNTSLIFFNSNSQTSDFSFTLSGGAATCDWCVFFNVRAITNVINATNSLNIGRNTNVNFTPPGGGGGGSVGNKIIGGGI